MAATKWGATLRYLMAHPDGVTLPDIADNFGVSLPGARQRINSLRDVLNRGSELGYTVPRPTADTGWTYRLCNVMVEDHVADVRRGQIDDLKNSLGLLERNYAEAEIVYEQLVATEPAGKRSKAAKYALSRQAQFASVIATLEADLAVLQSM